jgi:hypothetical protein
MIFDRKGFSDRVYDAVDFCTFIYLKKRTKEYVIRCVEMCAYQIEEELERVYTNERVETLKNNLQNGILKVADVNKEEEDLLNVNVGFDWRKKLNNEGF